jgi:hypothetical protein
MVSVSPDVDREGATWPTPGAVTPARLPLRPKLDNAGAGASLLLRRRAPVSRDCWSSSQGAVGVSRIRASTRPARAVPSREKATCRRAARAQCRWSQLDHLAEVHAGRCTDAVAEVRARCRPAAANSCFSTCACSETESELAIGSGLPLATCETQRPRAGSALLWRRDALASRGSRSRGERHRSVRWVGRSLLVPRGRPAGSP